MITLFNVNIYISTIHFAKLKNSFAFIGDIRKDKYRRLGDRCQRERNYHKAYFYYEASLREGNVKTIIPFAKLYLAEWSRLGLHPCDLEPIIKDAMSKGFDDLELEYFLQQIKREMREYYRMRLNRINMPF